jgi:formylglycine-generating enzyme required for sulfatase activity
VLPEASRRGCWSSPGWLTVIAGGSEFDARPGEVTAVPQRHDAWMVADEPVIVVDWYGASNYARS